EAAITSVHVSPDGHSIAAGSSDGGVIVWDLATGEETTRLPPQEAAVSCLRWSKGSDRLVIALGSWSQQEEAALLFWTPGKSFTRRGLEAPAGALDWLGEGESLIIAAWGGQCQIWNVAAGKATGGLVVEKDQVSAAAWSADCPLISKWLADQLIGR